MLPLLIGQLNEALGFPGGYQNNSVSYELCNISNIGVVEQEHRQKNT